MPAPGQTSVPDCFAGPRRDLMEQFVLPARPLSDIADLERRIADLEERAMRQDKEAAARDRLKAMGLVLPARS